jgi:hypothetical protein
MVQKNNAVTYVTRMIVASGDGFTVPNRSASADSGGLN